MSFYQENPMRNLIMLATAGLVVSAALLVHHRTEEAAAQTRQDVPADVIDGNVTLINDVDISAQEPGVLTRLHFAEGDSVKIDQLPVELDNTDALVRVEEARLNQEVARKEATNDINVRASAAAADVAQAEVDESIAVNDDAPGSIPQTKLRREKLTAERSLLQVDVAKLEYDVAGITAQIRGQQVQAAQNSLNRRSVKAPLAGVIERRYKDVGEWVTAGEPICQVVRMDRLRVEGFLPSNRFPPVLMLGRTITVRLKDQLLARQLERLVNRQIQLSGRISFVSNVIQAGGEYQVWAEIDNLAVGSQWILRPGTPVTLEIQAPAGN